MALQLRDKPAWTTFLTEAGIPATEADTYADIFINNRITDNNIKSLTAQHLTELQITVLGDRLSILGHVKTKFPTDTSTAASDTSGYRPPGAAAGLKPPDICNEMTHPQFRKLLVDWDVYKGIMKLPPSEVGRYLYSACDSSVQNSLVNGPVDFFSLDETEMLETIQGIVTKRVNPTVHRMNFSNIQQDDSSIQDFHTRLRSAAVGCEFTCPHCELDISDSHIRMQFINGISNEMLQTDILAKADQLESVTDVVKHAETFESAIRDQSELRDPSSEACAVSDYVQLKRNKKK